MQLHIWNIIDYVLFSVLKGHISNDRQVTAKYFELSHWGAHYIMGENLEAVWAEFTTLIKEVIFQSNVTAWYAHSHV